MAKGSIYPYDLADGSRRYLVMYRTSNGVQRKRKGFKGIREAERFLNQTIAAVDRGEVVATSDTFAEYIDRWLKEHRPRLEEGTYRDYRVHVERRLKPFFGRRKLEDIGPADIRRYVAELADGTGAGALPRATLLSRGREAARQLGDFTVPELAHALAIPDGSARDLAKKLVREGTVDARGEEVPRERPGRRYRVYRYSEESAASAAVSRRISNKTINNSLVVLRLALGHAEEDGLIARNPAATRPGARDRIRLPEEHREMDFLRLHEIPRYLDACEPWYRPLAEVLIACGLRISEALSINWPHIDTDGRRFLVLASQKRRGDGGEARGSTKGDRFRGVEFGPRILRILLEVRARQEEHGWGDPTIGPVFLGEAGSALDRHQVSQGAHKRALRGARLRTSLRLHDLRHTAAASWLACGLPLIYVQRQLGHASIRTTEGAYGHLEESFLRGAPERVEAAIWHGRLELPAGAR